MKFKNGDFVKTPTGRKGTVVSSNDSIVGVHVENMPPIPNPGETTYYEENILESWEEPKEEVAKQPAAPLKKKQPAKAAKKK